MPNMQNARDLPEEVKKAEEQLRRLRSEMEKAEKEKENVKPNQAKEKQKQFEEERVGRRTMTSAQLDER